MSEREQSPDLQRAAAGVALGFLVVIFSSVAVGLALTVWAALAGRPPPTPADPRVQALGLPLQHGALAVMAILLARASGDGVQRALALGPARRWPLVLLILPVGILADRVVQLARGVLPELGALDQLAQAVSAPGLVGAAVVFGAVVAAPVAEELLFRGYVFRGIERSLGPGVAVVGSAAVFGAYHVDPVHVAGALCIGLWLGWLRWATGSLWPCLAAHAANNLVWLISIRAGWTPEIPDWGVGLAALAVAAGLALSPRRSGLGAAGR